MKEKSENVPAIITLEQNYPNPFTQSTAIGYRLTAAGHVRLEVFDVLGRKVATLVDKEKDVGEYSVELNIHNLIFNIHPGIYLYKLTTSKNVLIRKMIYME